MNTRAFNTVMFNPFDNSITKKSHNYIKIISEYQYYYALPESIKRYFVRPYRLQMNDSQASYKTTYMSGQLMHHLNGMDFRRALCLVFKYKDECSLYFKTLSSNDSSKLVLSKTSKRLDELISSDFWNKFKHKQIIEDHGLSPIEIFKRLELAFKYYELKRKSNRSIVSHGDLHTENIFYENKKTIRMIDPKGVDYLYIDEYYDYAKLSHSIVGGYNSIINDNYKIIIKKNSMYVKNKTNKKNIILFKKKIKERGIDYDLLRVYEASLFLSMLPLHSENEDHVLAFIIKSNSILKELGY
jgi:hypothetical protein